MGHAPADTHHMYGDVELAVMYREICKHPRYDVGPRREKGGALK